VTLRLHATLSSYPSRQLPTILWTSDFFLSPITFQYITFILTIVTYCHNSLLFRFALAKCSYVDKIFSST
jgi:hypothetical protein